MIKFAFVAVLASLVACGGSKDSADTGAATSTSTSTAR
jgi:hypothetical protein